ncbi:MAG: hypothetical protein H6668_00035 [Ardenticatenaceae bacterium]|nr:hypothetical protein [Ardenticatenaceae bacterium]
MRRYATLVHDLIATLEALNRCWVLDLQAQYRFARPLPTPRPAPVR